MDPKTDFAVDSLPKANKLTNNKRTDAININKELLKSKNSFIIIAIPLTPPGKILWGTKKML